MNMGLAAFAALAITASIAAGTASATMLEVGGSAKNESVTITATLASGTSAILKDTSGFSQNTCTTSEVKGSTEGSFSGATLSGKVGTLTFGECDRTVSVHFKGSLSVSHITGTTNGTVSSSDAEVTTGSPFGTLTCVTNAGTHLGTLTGVSAGSATMHINANVDCGISAKLTATYTVTSPSGLGVVSEGGGEGGGGGGEGGNADLEPGSKKFKFSEWQNFRIRNTGPGSLTINSVTIDVTKGTSSAFVVEDPNNCKGKTLNSGGTCEVTVTCWEWEADGKLTIGTSSGSRTATLDSTP